MSICITQFRETMTPLMCFMSLMSDKEMHFQVPTKTVRLDRPIDSEFQTVRPRVMCCLACYYSCIMLYIL